MANPIWKHEERSGYALRSLYRSYGYIPYKMTGCDQFQLNLQRGVAQNAGQLGFGVHLGGHQIQQQDLQRTDILRHSAGFRHDKDIFFCQRAGGRELVGNFDGH